MSTIYFIHYFTQKPSANNYNISYHLLHNLQTQSLTPRPQQFATPKFDPKTPTQDPIPSFTYFSTPKFDPKTPAQNPILYFTLCLNTQSLTL